MALCTRPYGTLVRGLPVPETADRRGKKSAAEHPAQNSPWKQHL